MPTVRRRSRAFLVARYSRRRMMLRSRCQLMVLNGWLLCDRFACARRSAANETEISAVRAGRFCACGSVHFSREQNRFSTQVLRRTACHEHVEAGRACKKQEKAGLSCETCTTASRCRTLEKHAKNTGKKAFYFT